MSSAPRANFVSASPLDSFTSPRKGMLRMNRDTGSGSPSLAFRRAMRPSTQLANRAARPLA